MLMSDLLLSSVSIIFDSAVGLLFLANPKQQIFGRSSFESWVLSIIKIILSIKRIFKGLATITRYR